MSADRQVRRIQQRPVIMRATSQISALLGLVSATISVNFDWESIQLGEEDVTDFSAITFGNSSDVAGLGVGVVCRAYPGNPEWPSDDDWSRFNSCLAGVLLKPSPPGIVCYPGPAYNLTKCMALLRAGGESRFYLNDPVTVLTTWTTGNTCDVTFFPTGNCTQGGFSVYVVNVTNVRQIQAAVNFARNTNLRLVIKNTGHDFNGRSTGAGALSIWTHWLKSFEFIPNYTQGRVQRSGGTCGLRFGGMGTVQLHGHVQHDGCGARRKYSRCLWRMGSWWRTFDSGFCLWSGIIPAALPECRYCRWKIRYCRSLAEPGFVLCVARRRSRYVMSQLCLPH